MSAREGSSLTGGMGGSPVAGASEVGVGLERLVLQTAGEIRRVRAMADCLYHQVGGLEQGGGWRRGRLWRGAN
jgi:hypothetical protein